MRSLIFLLLNALPAFAQDKLPADPELAALEQDVLDVAILKFPAADLNLNNRCDPEEKAWLLALGGYQDLDGDGQADLLEGTIGQLETRWPLWFSFDCRKFFLDYKKQHPGSLKAKELRQAIEKDVALNTITELAGLSRQGAWQESLLGQLAKAEDHNHNGILDHDELLMRGAMDQVLYNLFSSTFCYDFDRNGDGVLSQEEHDAIVDMLKEDLDLDNDGTVSLNDLQVMAYVPDGLSHALVSPRDYPLSFKETFAEFTKKFLPAYDRNGDDRWQPVEMLFANKTASRLQEFITLTKTPDELDLPFEPQKPGDDGIGKFLANRDLNGNGRVDYAEIPGESQNNAPDFEPDPLDQLIAYRLTSATPPVDPEILKSLFPLPFPIQRTSKNPRIPAASLADCMKSLLTLYDHNHDGQLDAEEIRSGCLLESFLRDHLYDEKPFPFTIEQQQAWIAKMVAFYDKNQDGLSMIEALQVLEIETEWIQIRNLDETTQKLDKNDDGWLDPEERKTLETEILGSHDLNRNGSLEARELYHFVLAKTATRWPLDFQPLTPEEQADWNQKWRLFDFDEEGQPATWQVPKSSSMLFQIAENKPMTYKDLWRWHEFMLKNYDSNQNGRVDSLEIIVYEASVLFWTSLAETRKQPPTPASMPELQRWALENGDIDHDGKLSEKEQLYLNFYLDMPRRTKFKFSKELFELQKIEAKHPTVAEMKTVQEFWQLMLFIYPLYPEFDKNNNLSLDYPEEMQELAQYLLKTGDRNGNGRLDYEEILRFMQRHHAKVQEATKQLEQRLEEQIRRETATAQLQKYDRNGNGKLDAEEQAKADVDAQKAKETMEKLEQEFKENYKRIRKAERLN